MQANFTMGAKMRFGLKQVARFAVPLGAVFVTTTAIAGVTVSSPANGATVATPVRVVASASSTKPITAMRIYVDHVSVYVVQTNRIDTLVTLTPGKHSLVVQAWDSGGLVMKNVLDLNATQPVNKKVYSNIDQMTGWAHCDVCAGRGGQGPTTTYWQAQFQTSPSLDGASSEFFLGGSTPYAAALWWKQLGPNDSARFFVYELDLYFTDANAPQALEFDVNQSLNGKRYIFGTECGFKGAKTWRVWDYNLHWVSTGIPCTAITPKVWHHIAWEFERTTTGKTHFIAVTVDGVRKVVDFYGTPKPITAHELNVAFQMDGNSTMTDYHVWVDKIKLTVW
jgi:Bacterial Ig domain